VTVTPAVAIEDLEFAYGRHAVLTAVDFRVLRGAFVAIVGPNGGGKTTLLKLILGLLTPDRGRVAVLGVAPKQARRRVGYMPQQVNLDPRFPVSAGDVVLMGRLGPRHPLGAYRRADHQAAEQALAACGADALSDRPFSRLSGGQRQRVLIARAIAGEPDLLLLDEPTASLDPAIQDDLYELLKRLNERMTVVLVSHDVSTVSRHAKQVICVNVQVAQHDTTAIGAELARLFPGHAGQRLVRHDHHLEQPTPPEDEGL